MTAVAGVDGCPGGWIAVIWNGGLSHSFFREIAGVLALPVSVIAIDMPIGLPERAGRMAEKLARKGLGARQSSVFAIPCRDAVYAGDYRAACGINLAKSDPPRKIAKQTFHLFAKMREVDEAMTPELQRRVHECHPEAAFWAMNGCQPVALAKKVKNANHKPGLALRRGLLANNGFPVEALPPASYRKSDVGDDDLIDACACAWSARRILEGRHLSFPEEPERDARGLAMQIKA